MASTKVPIELSSTPGIVDNSNATAITIDSSENVGIGCTPYFNFDVQLNSSRRIGFNYSDSQNTILSHDGSGNIETLGLRGNTLIFYSDYDVSNPDGVQRMIIDSSGNVGIGETSPANKLHVKVDDVGLAPIDTAVLVLEKSGTNYINFMGSSTSTQGLRFGDSSDTGAGYLVYNHTDNSLQIGTNGPEKVRIDANGNLLVGRTTAEGNTQGLALQSNAQSKYCATFHNTGNDNGRIGIQIFAGTNNNSGTNTHISFGDGDGDGVGSITSSGGTVSYNAFTASHFVSLPNAEKESGYDYGTLVEITGVYYANPKHPRSIRYNVQKSQSSNSKKVLGAYSGNLSQSVHADTEGDYANNLHEVHVLGDGHILCNNEGGNISVGDGICTSSVAGIGMKATESPSMIIGIAQEDVTFDGSETKLVVVQYGLQQFTPWS